MKFTYMLVLLLSSACIVQAATVISGRVVNATHDNSAVPTARLTLEKQTPGAAVSLKVSETTASRTGAFRISLDAVDAASTYFVVTDFAGIRYVSAALTPAAGQTTDITLVVYDSTHSAAGVDAFMHHIMIDDIGSALQFRETHVLNNPGDKTIIQAISDDNVGPALARFHLPGDAKDFTPLSTHSAQDMIKRGDYVYDRGVFQPGQKTISFAYKVPMAQRQRTFSIDIPHTARSFDLFIDGKNLSVASSRLEDYGPFTIRGSQYHRYGAANVAAGDQIQFTVKRRGVDSPRQSPTLALSLTAILLLAGLLYSWNRPTKSKSQNTGASNKRKPQQKKRRKK